MGLAGPGARPHDGQNRDPAGIGALPLLIGMILIIMLLDIIMPDISYLVEERKNLLGIVLTHAHEDHFGAIMDLWPKLKCPIYATQFSAALFAAKCASERNPPKIPGMSSSLVDLSKLSETSPNFVQEAGAAGQAAVGALPGAPGCAQFGQQLAPGQHVECLVGSPHFHIARTIHLKKNIGVHSLKDRVKHLVHKKTFTALYALLKHVTFDKLLNRGFS